jgi:hypothetical protein
MLRKSVLVALLGFGLAAASGLAAHAADITVPEQQAVPPQQSAALDAYNANQNPLVTAPTTGVYDQGDDFRDGQGNPLPGWSNALYGGGE